MKNIKAIELLAPAKNLACGKAAIDHGADAVYIGADRFGARVGAGNSLEDIAELCRYAHPFGAKVYVTVNTIVYDNEFDDTIQLIHQLEEIGVDAILVQDMGVFSELLSPLTPHLSPLTSHLSPLQFHASTQTDNRTAEKVRWLRDLGFTRVVLARELTIEEIREIHQAVPDVELEVFVHGALCVSYSGQCYASQYCFGRSANRGACAQFCRLKFDLKDADGRMIEQGRHLLSLRDMCRIDHLEELLEAGAVSLKIEGRLKDEAYVKNVTAAYSQRLNQIIAHSNGKYRRSSHGNITYSFSPDLKKTFNRGFTDYFLHGRKADIFSPDTPKAMGEYVGKVKEVLGNSFTVAGTATFANGDGLCFFSHLSPLTSHLSPQSTLEGFRVNRVEGNRLFPLKMPAALRKGMALYRNNDVEFERQMKGQTAVRKIPVKMTLEETETGFLLRMYKTGQLQNNCLRNQAQQDDGMLAQVEFPLEKQQAEKPQRENIVRQLTKLGGTPYECHEVTFVPDDFNFFIPSSQLAEMRRKLVSVSRGYEETDVHVYENRNLTPPSFEGDGGLPYLYNASNEAARAFYREQGVSDATSLETNPVRKPLLMQCRHCLRFSLGWCRKQRREEMPWREPLFLHLPDGSRYRLEFDCKHCQMNVYGDK